MAGKKGDRPALTAAWPRRAWVARCARCGVAMLHWLYMRREPVRMRVRGNQVGKGNCTLWRFTQWECWRGGEC